ncbi:arylsulfatase A [Rubidibacter lacunae KORDI 51-2]|uniref:Arylsulfatase A n=1 Tax=Rubidibacter lacunae KORDI 51-2 TaxID=582515 RepID=U5DI48_9CHRO|nr:sulfatase [Rubidibacter lacunae]ERN40607.1 arylsulfatase A [Rubidibacter lacunae KORDI 51-2]
MQPLDIVLLVLDTQRADRLSCYGYERPTSPHLDAFAAEATRFQQAIAPAQWTIPSHASMFTGVYPSQHGAVQSYSVLPSTLPTLAERLREGGYHTAAFCNNPLVGVLDNGLRRGFTSFLNYSGLLTSHPNQAGIAPNLVDRYRQFFKGTLARLLGRIQDTFARSEAMLALSFTPLMVPLWQTALSFKGNTAKSLADAAELLCDRPGLPSDRPVFSFINLMGTHMPYHPPHRYIEQFAPRFLIDRSARRYLHQFNSDVYGWLAPLADPLSDAHKTTLDGMYDAEVAAQDEHLGRFFAQLAAGGVLDRALVIICADHGEHLGEKQLLGHTNALYNELTHVPLIVRDPRGGFPAGVRSETVSTRRIFHTALGAAGLTAPDEESLDLARSTTEPGVVFAEGIPPANVLSLLRKRQPDLVRDRACDLTSLAVWDANFKLQTKVATDSTEPAGISTTELYHLLDDPRETLNLRDVLPEEVDRLQSHLTLLGTQSHSAGRDLASNVDDPDVMRRLRDLGYLE